VLYRQLADWAEEIGNGAPIVAAGHLACVGARVGDAPREIHRIGNLDGVPASIFDPRFRYVALGHLHRMFRVRDSRAWYAGTPVPLGVGESSSPRHVLRVEITDANAEPVVTPLPVPFARRVVAVTGRPEQVVHAVRGLSWDTPLPPLVVVEATVDHYRVGLDGEVLAAAQRNDGPSPIIATVRQTREMASEQGQTTAMARPLRELTPEEVFRELCRAQRVALDDEMLAAFRSLLDEEVPA
jgi:exonuclease SbcD